MTSQRPCESCIHAGFKERKESVNGILVDVPKRYCEYKKRYVDDRTGACTHQDPIPEVYQIDLGCCGSCTRMLVEEVPYSFFISVDGTKMAIPNGMRPPAMICMKDGEMRGCPCAKNCSDWIGEE